MTDDKPAIPCGLVAKSYFNDTFTLHFCPNNDCTNKQALVPVTINETNIAWESDKTYKFANSKDLPDKTTW